MKSFPQVSPESAGVSSKALLNMMKKLSGLKYLNSIIVLRHGRSILECFLEPYECNTPHQLFSLSKSFVSCAVGLAQSEGRLKLSDTLISFFPEYDGCVTDPRMRKATLRDLLTMRSGHLVGAEDYMLGKQDFVKAYLASPLDTEPGTRFTYNSGATYMLSAVIRKVTGENVREYLMPRLFEPLRISPGIWETCPKGIDLGGWGFYLTTGDLAKFAQLLLQHGEWQGRQILPPDYLAEAVSKQADNSMNENPDWKLGYGYQFWISKYGYRGDGAGGQLAVILEDQDLCIAATSSMNNMQELLNIFWDELVPHLKPDPLPEAPEDWLALKNYAAALKIPVPAAENGQRRAAASFCFRENTAGVRQCDISFGDDCCALTFHYGAGMEQLRAGFGHFEYSVLRLTDSMPRRTAAYALWTAPDVLEIHSFICDGIVRYVWTVDFSDREEPVRSRNICGCFHTKFPKLISVSPKTERKPSEFFSSDKTI